MSHRFVQIYDGEDGYWYIEADCSLSGEVSEPNMIPVDEDFDIENKRWNGSSWESYTPPEPPEPQPSQLDRIEEQINKNQDDLRQEGANMMMEELIKRGVVK